MANESDSRRGYDDKITITLDRELAEDLYYSLLLALGGRDYGEDRVGKNGKTTPKSYQGYPSYPAG
jgi:hypothetical protein